jgi:hypothetical protein
MNTELHRALLQPTDGVVGLADDLLRACPKEGLQIDWHADRCWVYGTDGAAIIDVPLRKSAFRAMLARVACLCNDWKPDSVSPYRGDGELALDKNPEATFRVTFVNTPDEQRLTIMVLSATHANHVAKP